MNSKLEKLCHEFYGPMFFEYISWIISEALKNNHKKIYFLARDGYLLKIIAENICRKFNIEIDCRYLYCSRLSMRIPTYSFIGDEKYSLLFSKGNYNTYDSVLSRLNLTVKEKEQLYEECGFMPTKANILLNSRDFDNFCNTLKDSVMFSNIVQEKSSKAYVTTIQYFMQEGLFDDDKVVIVDSGWSGSIQRSMCQLLRHEGYKGEIFGYYFGMFTNPKSNSDGHYNSWLFSPHMNPFVRVNFCNNTFEAILSAPHGMTLEYKNCGNTCFPIMSSIDPKAIATSNSIVKSIEEYVAEKLDNTETFVFNCDKGRKSTAKLIKRFMSHPTVDEVEAHADITFGTEMTESDLQPLVSAKQLDHINSLLLHNRIRSKIRGTTCKNDEGTEIFWIGGLLAYLPPLKRLFYRMNVYIWELAKCFIIR